MWSAACSVVFSAALAASATLNTPLSGRRVQPTPVLQLRGGSNLDLLTTEEELDYEISAAGPGVLVVVDFMADWW